MARSPSSHGRGSGDGGGSEDKHRKKLIASDVGRKRSSSRYVYAGQPIPEKLQYRAVAEYDCMVVAKKRGEGSSANAARHGDGSSHDVRTPMRTPIYRLVIRNEAPPQQDEAHALASTISLEDFVPDEEEDRMVALICARTARDEDELQEARRADAVLLEAGLAADRAYMERAAYWKSVVEADTEQCVDLTSNAE